VNSSLITITVLTGLAMAAVILYFLPVLVGYARHVPGSAMVVIVLVDVILGWTLIGWLVALILAFQTVYPAGPVVQVVQNVPPAPPPPGQLPGAGWAGPPGAPPTRPDSPPPLVLPPRPSPPGASG
jgi:hypothetical protein